MKTKPFDPYDFSTMEIDGVRVYYKNLPWAPCIHIDVSFNTGAFMDPLGKEGLSHFLEHMIFDGSPLLPNKKTIKEWSKINTLNTWNASTGYHRTSYHLECLPEKFDEVLKGMKDMIFFPHLRDEDVEHERKVITQEAWGRYKNEKYLQYLKWVNSIIYHGHTHERIQSPLGWPETIERITGEDIRGWHKKNYGIGNFHIIITGNIDDASVEKLKGFISGLPTAEGSPLVIGPINKPKENKWIKPANEIGEIAEQVEITFARFAPKKDAIMRWIDSGFRRLAYDILYERLRLEQSLCYGIRVSTYTFQDHSESIINVKTDEKNIEIVEKEFNRAIKEIIEGKHRERFELIHTLGIDQYKSEEFLSDNVIDTVSWHIEVYGSPLSKNEGLEEMKKVTYEQVSEYVKNLFNPDYMFTEIILPSKE